MVVFISQFCFTCVAIIPPSFPQVVPKIATRSIRLSDYHGKDQYNKKRLLLFLLTAAEYLYLSLITQLDKLYVHRWVNRCSLRNEELIFGHTGLPALGQPHLSQVVSKSEITANEYQAGLINQQEGNSSTLTLGTWSMTADYWQQCGQCLGKGTNNEAMSQSSQTAITTVRPKEATKRQLQKPGRELSEEGCLLIGVAQPIHDDLTGQECGNKCS